MPGLCWRYEEAGSPSGGDVARVVWVTRDVWVVYLTRVACAARRGRMRAGSPRDVPAASGGVPVRRRVPVLDRRVPVRRRVGVPDGVLARFDLPPWRRSPPRGPPVVPHVSQVL